ncbi:MAG: hypothetical protein ABI641_16275 [Caldimonas sp.]
MRFLPCLVVACLAALATAAARADGDGLSADSRRAPWDHVQGRIAYATELPGQRTGFAGVETSGLKVRGVSVMGDVYFGDDRSVGRVRGGGFRATSGLIVGAHDQLWGTSAAASAYAPVSVERRVFGQAPGLPRLLNDGATDSGTLPYLGIGYSRLTARSGWSFSADLGVVSLSPGNATRFGRVFGGGQSLDDVIRDMRLSPVLQLGASYAF